MVHRISRAECDISKFSFFQPLLPLSFGLSFCGIWPIKKMAIVSGQRSEK